MSIKFNEVVIAAAVRTPIGTFKGSLKNIKADQLGTIVIKEVINRGNVNSKDIDEVILGQVLTAGSGQNPARQASINAGLPKSVPAYLVNQVCGSGLRSVILGFQTIKLNEAKYMNSKIYEVYQKGSNLGHGAHGVKLVFADLLCTF